EQHTAQSRLRERRMVRTVRPDRTCRERGKKVLRGGRAGLRFGARCRIIEAYIGKLTMERFRPRQNANLKSAWPKGHSGNPGARPKVLADLRDWCRQHTQAAVRELIRLCTKARREEVRLAAIRELLDRGFGRPVSADCSIMTQNVADKPVASVVYVPYQA